MPAFARFLILVLLLGSMDAGASERGPLNDRFTIDLGYYFMESDTQVRADSISGINVQPIIGDPIKIEELFNMSDDDVFRLEGAWRFFPRHKIRLMYFDSDRSSTATASTELSFGDVTFPVGVEIDARLKWEIIELAYEYDFLKRETYELGASIGIHNVGFKTELTGSVFIPGTTLTETATEDVRADAPLPVIGLRGHWNFAGDFYLQGHAQYFQLEYEGYDGSIQDYQFGVLWQFSRHIGAGVSYNLFQTDVDIDDGDDFQGKLDWTYEGGQVYLRATF